MRPGDIQDEGSDHEHQTVDMRFRSWCKSFNFTPKYYLNWRYAQTYNAFKQMLRNLNWRYSHLCGIPRKRRSGSLSIARRRQLDAVLFEINKTTALMTEDIRTPELAQFINPAMIKKLAAVKNRLEVVAAKINTCKKKNKQHDTPQLERHAISLAVAARRQFRYLDKLAIESHRAALTFKLQF